MSDKNRFHPGSLWQHDLPDERGHEGHAMFVRVNDLKDELYRINADQDELQETRDACADLFRMFFGEEMPH
jgi:hypothetical protein